jgi:predicted ArsR family transcriptional regulator
MSPEPATTGDDLTAISLLGEPVRRALYEWVVAQGRPVGRDESARALGVTRALATFHLDRLAESGLLGSGYRRLNERRGPGAGRPARVYWRADREISVTMPERRYDRIAHLLAHGAEVSARSADAARDAARAAGREIGARARRGRRRSPTRVLREALESEGYEQTALDDEGVIRLRNCPYDALVDEHRSLVCDMNLAMAEGLVEAVGAGDQVRPVLDPQPGSCCVAFVPRRG